MASIRWTRAAAAATLGTLLAACGIGTAPDVAVELDTDAALADYDAMEAALAAADVPGLRALGGRAPLGTAPSAVDLIEDLAGGGAGARGTRTLALLRRLRAARAHARPSAAPIISEAHRGATFVYDPVADDYVVDPRREGAPETGVRFVLYDVDDAGVPIAEAEVGYADLVDEGDDGPEDIALRLRVVRAGTTVLDYRTTLDEDGPRGELTVRGFLVGDRVRLDFDIEAVGSGAGGAESVDVTWDLRVERRDFEITGSVRGIHEGEDGFGAVELTVRHHDLSFRVDVEGHDGTLEGTIYLNGDVFATVSGPEDGPTFLGRGGGPLTFGERLVLHRIFDSIEDVFDLLEDLVDPVDDLVILGIVL